MQASPKFHEEEIVPVDLSADAKRLNYAAQELAKSSEEYFEIEDVSPCLDRIDSN